MMHPEELNPGASPHAAFGARLRSSREARGWTQKDLSARIGISSGHISGVETTRKVPSLQFAKAADSAFGVTGAEATFERQWHETQHGSLLEETQGHLDRETSSVLHMPTKYHQLQAGAVSQAASVDMINEARKGTP
ncbi:helix-turn-helix domain-containing protein [Streptomyces sp. SID4919]|uniref:helix-turn-helix domain-containing protein n=1 Tax=Streptomyces sp. SID4919 TaxID=2690270 RepID=UPI000C0787B8|nr:MULTISPECIES: helix-turn-helix transcriptional regulator [unclassified Streptomyces]MYY10037.1 helix-turn-helix domain-containing protein [Streptomyces sp. SID4919]